MLIFLFLGNENKVGNDWGHREQINKLCHARFLKISAYIAVSKGTLALSTCNVAKWINGLANPFIHFATLHVLSARVPFDTAMYAEIFKNLA